MVGFDPETKDRELSAYEYSTAGFLSGIGTRAIAQPLDVLKIRFQLQEEPIMIRISKLQPGKYSGLLSSIRLIYREEGLTAFWKGHIPAQCLSAIYGLVQFTSFEMLTKQVDLMFDVKTQTELVDFGCGSISGCIATTSAMPFDVIRTRLVAQGEPKVYRGFLHAIHKIWKDEKAFGFFRGLTPSLVQIAPYINPNIRQGFGATSEYKGMIRGTIQIVKKERLHGLFKGLLPSMVKAGLSSGLSFMFYELACNAITLL